MDDLCKSITQFHYQMKKVAEIHKNLQEFNHVFASFLLGIQLQAECISLSEIVSIPQLVSSPNPQDIPNLVDTVISDDIKQNHKESIQNTAQTQISEKRPSQSKQKSHPQSITKRHTLSFVMKKITANIPLAVRDLHQLGEIELLVKILIGKPDGEYLNEIYTQCPLDKHRTMQWLNLLVRTQDIVKVSRKGLLYQLNPEKYLL